MNKLTVYLMALTLGFLSVTHTLNYTFSIFCAVVISTLLVFNFIFNDVETERDWLLIYGIFICLGLNIGFLFNE